MACCFLQKTWVDFSVSLLTGWQVGLICQLVFRAVGGGTSPGFRLVPFAVPWFRQVPVGQVVVASCLGSPRVFRGLPGWLGRGGGVVGLFCVSLGWAAG